MIEIAKVGRPRKTDKTIKELPKLYYELADIGYKWILTKKGYYRVNPQYEQEFLSLLKGTYIKTKVEVIKFIDAINRNLIKV